MIGVINQLRFSGPSLSHWTQRCCFPFLYHPVSVPLLLPLTCCLKLVEKADVRSGASLLTHWIASPSSPEAWVLIQIWLSLLVELERSNFNPNLMKTSPCSTCLCADCTVSSVHCDCWLAPQNPPDAWFSIGKDLTATDPLHFHGKCPSDLKDLHIVSFCCTKV